MNHIYRICAGTTHSQGGGLQCIALCPHTMLNEIYLPKGGWGWEWGWGYLLPVQPKRDVRDTHNVRVVSTMSTRHSLNTTHSLHLRRRTRAYLCQLMRHHTCALSWWQFQTSTTWPVTTYLLDTSLGHGLFIIFLQQVHIPEPAPMREAKRIIKLGQCWSGIQSIYSWKKSRSRICSARAPFINSLQWNSDNTCGEYFVVSTS